MFQLFRQGAKSVLHLWLDAKSISLLSYKWKKLQFFWQDAKSVSHFLTRCEMYFTLFDKCEKHFTYFDKMLKLFQFLSQYEKAFLFFTKMRKMFRFFSKMQKVFQFLTIWDKAAKKPQLSQILLVCNLQWFTLNFSSVLIIGKNVKKLFKYKEGNKCKGVRSVVVVHFHMLSHFLHHLYFSNLVLCHG